MDLPTGTVTFVFTDIESSTRLVHSLGDRYRAVLDAHSNIIENRVGETGGLVVNTEGDAYFCVFSDAVNAVTASVAIQRDLAKNEWPADANLRVRIGIHTGTGTRGGRDYTGIDVHRAARIASAGHGGQILISAETQGLVRRRLPARASLVDLGEHRLKDLPQPEQIFQVVVAGLESDFPALRSVGGRPSNLPAALNSFVGRSEAIEEISERLGRARLVTLVGPGGSGKTRLALELGGRMLEQFSGGVWIAELATQSEPIGVVRTVAAAFGLREWPGVPLTTTVTEHLTSRSALVILDNCEHLLAPAAALTDELLRQCPDIRILATSRQPLRLSGEVTRQVAGLATPGAAMAAKDLMEYEAVQLFAERAADRIPGFEVAPEHAAVVAQICERLDGIPLAIELAASRVQVLGLTQIAERLDDRFRLLTGGSPVDLPHHQTLRLAIDWSYELLTPEEADLFAWLSVFKGGFTLEAAEAVGGAVGIPRDVLDVLGSLVEKSLVVVDDAEDRRRYRLLETIGEYARGKLTDAARSQEAVAAHWTHYLEVAEAAEPALQGIGGGSAQPDVLDRLERDHENFRAALDRLIEAGSGLAVNLAGALWRYWEVRGHLTQGSETLARALGVDDDVAPAIRARALDGAGRLAWRRGVLNEAEELFLESLELWRSAGDRAGEANALHGLARAAINQGNEDDAQEFADQSLQIYRDLGDRYGMSIAINTLGEVARSRGKFATAHRDYLEALSIQEEIGDIAARVSTEHNVGYTSLALGDIDGSEARFRNALERAHDLRDQLGIFSSIGGLAAVAVARGDAERAATLFGASTALGKEGGYASDRVDRVAIEYNITRVRATLAPTVFEAAWQAGREMDPDDAIAYALSI